HPGLSLADFTVQILVLSGEHGIEGLQDLRVDALADDRHGGGDSSTGWAAPPAWIGSQEGRLRRHQEEEDGPEPERRHGCSLMRVFASGLTMLVWHGLEVRVVLSTGL